MKTRTMLLTVSALAALSPPAVAQSPPADQPAGTFGETIDVTVVDVQAVVTDPRGRRVTGLGPDDFRVLVDGEPVPIAFFDEVREGRVVAAEGTADRAGAPARPAALAAGEAAPASYLVFVDDYFGVPRDRNLVLDRLADQLSALGPGDRVAAVAFDGDRLDLLFGWTGDREEIARGLAAAKKRKGWKAFVEVQRERRLGETGGTEIAYRQARMKARQLSKVYRALMVTLEAFSDAPGRRVGLIVSGGWPFSVSPGEPGGPRRPDWIARGAIDRLAATANSVGFTLYPIDAPGLESSASGSAAYATSAIDRDPNQPPRVEQLANALGEGSSDGREAPDPALMDFPEVPIYADAFGEFENEAALLTLAARTGGKAMINGQRLHALAEAAADAGTYYWLGFEFDRRRDGDFHSIRVELNRPGLEARARQGFVDLTRGLEAALVTERAAMLGTDPGAAGDGAAPRHEELAVELGEPRRAGRGKVDLPFAVTIPMDRIVVQRTPKGAFARLELRVVTMDDEGNRSDLTTIPLELPIDARTARLPAISYEAAVRVQREPHALVFTLADKVGGGLLVGRRDWAP